VELLIHFSMVSMAALESIALQAAQDCAKKSHDFHPTPLHFQLGDRVCMDKQRFKGHHHHKIHPLRYGPYTVL